MADTSRDTMAVVAFEPIRTRRGGAMFLAFGVVCALLGAAFRCRPRDAWAETFAQTDACVAPVLTLTEAAMHPHNRARGTFVELNGVVQPAPAPLFSRTPSGMPHTARPPETSAWGRPVNQRESALVKG